MLRCRVVGPSPLAETGNQVRAQPIDPEDGRATTPRAWRRARVVVWNVLLSVAGVGLIAIAMEAYLRVTRPFETSSTSKPLVFVANVGAMLAPFTEVRHTNGLDYWTVSRANSWGFLDREPPSAVRARDGCHIAIIGDSMIEARQVAIRDKLQVRLEELAANELPHLRVTTSAFGVSGMGQINQLPLYDEFARRLHPKMLVIVFVGNDVIDNSPILTAIRSGMDPDALDWQSVERQADGTLELRPPHPDYGTRRQQSLLNKKRDSEQAFAARWLKDKTRVLVAASDDDRRADPDLFVWAERLVRHPKYQDVFKGWQLESRVRVRHHLSRDPIPPVFAEAMNFTAFGLDQFKARAERDGAALVLFFGHRTDSTSDITVRTVTKLAEQRHIPAIDMNEHLQRHGRAVRDAQWRHDAHWNPNGHQWAAEAVFEYLSRHQAICVAERTPTVTQGDA